MQVFAVVSMIRQVQARPSFVFAENGGSYHIVVLSTTLY